MFELISSVSYFNLNSFILKVTIKEHELIAQEAARSVEGYISEAIEAKGTANIILATGNSQLLFLKALRERSVSWEKVIIFHLDEYLGLDENHPSSFRHYLKENIIKHISPKEFYPINTEGKSLDKAIEYYTQLLVYHPVDIACIGIGENGHLAFNDPGVANFNDQKSVKVVSLDKHCRKQQYDEGWFDSIEAVPKKALTLTIPTIMSAQHISCFVPDERKANAVRNTLEGDIVEACPASVLRNHPSVNLYLDPPSAKLLKYQ